jgi:hypothetical protein
MISKDEHFSRKLIVIDLRTLASDIAKEITVIKFPGWDVELAKGTDMEAIARVASAIMATALEVDDITEVSAEDMSKLIHYIADMLET